MTSATKPTVRAADVAARRSKPSGVEWLGNIPVDWHVRRLKHVATVTPSSVDKLTVEGEVAVRLCNYTDVYNLGRITSSIGFMNATASLSEVEEFAILKGDVLITKDSESWDDIAVPALGAEDLPGVLCGYHLARVRPIPEIAEGPFLFYAFLAKPIAAQFKVEANGVTRFALGRDAIGSARFPFPPLPEQRAIAAFLDRETARIDALIAQKERLIALLEEKRSALISRAVTRGLDPNVELKESGVEWIGEVPRHWEVPPLYARFEVQLGKMLDAKTISGTHLAPYLRNVDVQWDRINAGDLPEMDFDEQDREKFALRSDDLLVCEGGEVGRAAIWVGALPECYYQKALHRLRPRTRRDVPRFLFYVLFAAARGGVFAAYGNPNTIDHLTADDLRHYRFPFPPAEEQQRIVTHLDQETSNISSLASLIREGTQQLAEYRAALISAAVTGKIDVRDAA